MKSEQREALIARGIEAGDSDEPLQLDVATISDLLSDSERAEQLQDLIDLARDEFVRIAALTESGEIQGICDRAQIDIIQRVPVINQRDQLTARITELERELADKQNENAALRNDRMRLMRALERIGCFFAGTEHQHVADKTLLVLQGKTIDEACVALSIAKEDAR